MCISTLSGHNDYVRSIACIHNSNFIVSGSDTTIKIWNYITRQCISTLKGHAGFVYSVNLIPKKNRS